MIENQAGIRFQKIGVPQPEQVIKASSRDTFKALEEVNEKVVSLFSEAADDLIEQEFGDARKALCKTLALISGHHKEAMKARSLLTGTEDLVTFQVKLRYPFHSVSMVWNILKRFCPEQITSQVRGMRAFKDMSGACFDVAEHLAVRLEDIFNHAA